MTAAPQRENVVRSEFSRQADAMASAAWTNHREFGEWMKITNAPERVGPLERVMAALARCGATAGIGLRLENDRLLFEHTAGLTIAVKP